MGIRNMNTRTKHLDISRAVRAEVYERDNWNGGICCVACGKASFLQIHHYIPRSLSGLAIPENLVVLCIECHEKADHGKPIEREDMKRRIREHLQWKYPYWDETQLTYRRQ